MKNYLIIINYNDSDNTIKLIDEIKLFTSIEKVIVVDNNSKEDLDKLKNMEDEFVHLISLEKNLGYSGAINEGCKYIISNESKKCNIIISNSDISIPSNNVIKSLAKNLSNDAVGAIMPKVLEHGVFKYGWKLTSAKEDVLLNTPLINKLYRSKFLNYDLKHFDNALPVVDVLYGCFFMIKSEVLEDINFFDDKVFLYYEENILARKLKAKKLLTVVDTSVFVEHKHNVSIGNNVSNLKKYEIYKNSQIYYEEHYNDANKVEMFIFKSFYKVSLIIKKALLKIKRKSN